MPFGHVTRWARATLKLDLKTYDFQFSTNKCSEINLLLLVFATKGPHLARTHYRSLKQKELFHIIPSFCAPPPNISKSCDKSLHLLHDACNKYSITPITLLKQCSACIVGTLDCKDVM